MKKNNKDLKITIRDFLNRPNQQEPSVFVAYFSCESTRYNSLYAEGTLSISDCSRTINLDLSFTSKEEYENSMYKLATIVNKTQEAINALVKARVHYETLEKEKKLEEEKEKEKQKKNYEKSSGGPRKSTSS